MSWTSTAAECASPSSRSVTRRSSSSDCRRTAPDRRSRTPSDASRTEAPRRTSLPLSERCAMTSSGRNQSANASVTTAIRRRTPVESCRISVGQRQIEVESHHRLTRFLPARRLQSTVFSTATCPSVCPSVCHTPVLCLNG